MYQDFRLCQAEKQFFFKKMQFTQEDPQARSQRISVCSVSAGFHHFFPSLLAQANG
jgi:hypothetical protein